MFKVGDKVICLNSHKFAPELFRGRSCTITGVRYDEREDSKYLIVVDESIGMFSSMCFEHYEIYHRKDKIEQLKIKMDRIRQSFFS